MKILNLIIKQKYFDAILDGRKVQEFREVRPTTFKKLLQVDYDGYEKTDEPGNSLPVEYHAIRFYVGYNKNRDSALVEVKGAHCECFVDDDGKIISYEYGIDSYGEPRIWTAQQVVYDLGKILETNINRDKS